MQFRFKLMDTFKAIVPLLNVMAMLRFGGFRVVALANIAGSSVVEDVSFIRFFSGDRLAGMLASKHRLHTGIYRIQQEIGNTPFQAFPPAAPIITGLNKPFPRLAT